MTALTRRDAQPGHASPLPRVGGAEERSCAHDLAGAGIDSRHDVVDVDPVGIVDLFAAHDLARRVDGPARPPTTRPVRSRGRGGRRGRGCP